MLAQFCILPNLALALLSELIYSILLSVIAGHGKKKKRACSVNKLEKVVQLIVVKTFSVHHALISGLH